MPGMNGLFMINDPGVEAAVQVRSRSILVSAGSDARALRYMDTFSNGDSVPATIITTTASSATSGFQALNSIFIPELQRNIIFLNSFPTIRNNNARYSDNLGLTWTDCTFSARQGRGGLWVPNWNRVIGFGITNSSAPVTGLMMSSSNGGINFTLQQSIAGGIFFSQAAYSPRLDIAVAANAGTATKNCCYWTTDATTWYAGTFSGTSFSPQEGHIVWQSYWNTFLVSRNGSTNANCLAISSDGKNWDPITATGLAPIGSSLAILSMAHNPITGRTVVGLFSGASSANVLYYSDNGGYNWTVAPVASNAYFIEYGRYDINTDMFIFTTRNNGSANGIFMSSNGINWTFYNQPNGGSSTNSFPIP